MHCPTALGTSGRRCQSDAARLCRRLARPGSRQLARAGLGRPARSQAWQGPAAAVGGRTLPGHQPVHDDRAVLPGCAGGPGRRARPSAGSQPRERASGRCRRQRPTRAAEPVEHEAAGDCDRTTRQRTGATSHRPDGNRSRADLGGVPAACDEPSARLAAAPHGDPAAPAPGASGRHRIRQRGSARPAKQPTRDVRSVAPARHPPPAAAPAPTPAGPGNIIATIGPPSTASLLEPAHQSSRPPRRITRSPLDKPSAAGSHSPVPSGAPAGCQALRALPRPPS